MRLIIVQNQEPLPSHSAELGRLERQMFSQQMELNNANEAFVRGEATANPSTGIKAALTELDLRQKERRIDELQVRVDVTKKAWKAERRRLGLADPDAQDAPTAVAIAPERPSFIGLTPPEVYGGAAGFLLLLPIVFAFARRIWRGGSRSRRETALEGSQQITRLEEAVESIAIEVERIGEAQRFAAKLAAERPREPVIERLRDSTRRVVTPLP